MGKHSTGQRPPLLTDLPLFKTALASAGVLLTGAGSLAVWAVGEIEHLQHHATVIQRHTDQLSGGLDRLRTSAESNAAKAARLRDELARLTEAQPAVEQPVEPPAVKQGVKPTVRPSPRVTARKVPVAAPPVQTAARPSTGPPPPLGLPKLPGLPGSPDE